MIKPAHPTRRQWVAFWCLLALWPLWQVADLVTTWVLVGARQVRLPAWS